MGREALEGLRASPKPAASWKINKWIISHPISFSTETVLQMVVIVLSFLSSSPPGKLQWIFLNFDHFLVTLSIFRDPPRRPKRDWEYSSANSSCSRDFIDQSCLLGDARKRESGRGSTCRSGKLDPRSQQRIGPRLRVSRAVISARKVKVILRYTQYVFSGTDDKGQQPRQNKDIY